MYKKACHDRRASVQKKALARRLVRQNTRCRAAFRRIRQHEHAPPLPRRVQEVVPEGDHCDRPVPLRKVRRRHDRVGQDSDDGAVPGGGSGIQAPEEVPEAPVGQILARFLHEADRGGRVGEGDVYASA